ncbi:MAG: L-threonylcarbamoyladenylate synthase [Sediminibacterium sp.]
MITTNIETAKLALENNDIVAIPTETVYGLAGNAYNEDAIHKIFTLKNRPHYNPLIVHIKSASYLQQVAKNIPAIAIQLADAFWPGPLTLVLEKQDHIPAIVTGGKNTVGVRVPAHPVALELLEALDFPLAAPSANPFGSISPTTAKHVHDYFTDTLETILDGGPCTKGIESTIIGFENEQPILYRQGSISIEDIEKITGKLNMLVHNDNNAPAAPGMLSRHYAPNTTTILTDDIDIAIEQYERYKIGLLLFKNTMVPDIITTVEVLSNTGDTEEAAKNLYAAMHRLDKQNLDIIIAERLPNAQLGIAINDKLERATKK